MEGFILDPMKVLSQHFLGVAEKLRAKINQDIWCPGRDSNRGSPEYKECLELHFHSFLRRDVLVLIYSQG
jgi:hypothetical protein